LIEQVHAERGKTVVRAYLLVVCLILSLLIAASGEAETLNHPPWSERFYQFVEEQYGGDAGKRLRFLETFILEHQNIPVMEKLVLVNKTMNRLPWIADSDKWKRSDYWATPLQTITTFGGDCEDIAIVKWFVLNHLGVPNENLRLAYVKFRTSRGTYGSHMVLIYLVDSQKPVDRQPVYVLDNNLDEVRLAKERSDLYAVHLIDAEGNVTLIAESSTGRSVREELKEREIRQLSELKRRIAADRNTYLEFSDGTYFMPMSF